jgi:hypothetical protein
MERSRVRQRGDQGEEEGDILFVLSRLLILSSSLLVEGESFAVFLNASRVTNWNLSEVSVMSLPQVSKRGSGEHHVVVEILGEKGFRRSVRE